MSVAYEKGLVLYRQRRYAGAAEQFALATQADPRSAAAYSMLALSLNCNGKREIAESAARQALTINPDSPFAHYALGFVLMTFHPSRFLFGLKFLPRASANEHLRQLKLSIASAKEAVRLRPTDADFHELVAHGESQRRKWRRVLTAAEAGLAHDPTHDGCLKMSSLALRHLGRTEAAFDRVRRGLRDHPENDALHAERGWAELESGRARAATDHFREALRLNPSNLTGRSGLTNARRAERFRAYGLAMRIGLWANHGGRPTSVVACMAAGVSAGYFKDHFYNDNFVAFWVAVSIVIVTMIVGWCIAQLWRRLRPRHA